MITELYMLKSLLYKDKKGNCRNFFCEKYENIDIQETDCPLFGTTECHKGDHKLLLQEKLLKYKVDLI